MQVENSPSPRITSPSMLCHHTRPGISYISMCLPGLIPQGGTGSTDLKHPCRYPSALLFTPLTHTPIKNTQILCSGFPPYETWVPFTLTKTGKRKKINNPSCCRIDRESSELVSLPLQIRAQIILDLGPTLMTSFHCNFHLKDLIFK